MKTGFINILSRAFLVLGVWVVVSLSLLGTLSGCAQQTKEPVVEWQQASFDAWIAKNEPSAVRHGDLYIKYIDTTMRANLDSVVMLQFGQTYVQMDYTGRTLDENIFAIRSKALAELTGSYAVKTHYCDDFVLLQEQNATFSKGLALAMGYLRKGDSVQVFLPIPLSYNEAFGVNDAYRTSYTKYENFPVRMDLRIREFTNVPGLYEVDSVNRIAAKNWGMSIADTVTRGMYMRKIVTNPTGAEITKDSNVYFYFAQYFTDGFLIKSNMDSVIKASPEYTVPKGGNFTGTKPLPIKPFSSSLDQVFSYALSRMRKGEVAEVYTISLYTEDGNVGKTAGKPQILPYQPTRYLIKALTDQQYKETL